MVQTERKKAYDRERMQKKRAASARMIDDLQYLTRIMLDNDPNEQIADNGMTVLDSWRDMAAKVLDGR